MYNFLQLPFGEISVREGRQKGAGVFVVVGGGGGEAGGKRQEDRAVG